MTNGKHVQRSEPLVEYLNGRISRAQLLTALGVGAAAAAIPGLAATASAADNLGAGRYSFPFFPQTSGSYTTENPVDIISNVLTLKTFDASLGAFAFGNAALLSRLGVVGLTKSVFQAIIAQDQYHIDWLSSLVPGAAPVTTTFTVDPALAASTQTFAAFAMFTGYLYMGAQLAAAREFAELGQPTLAKNMAQMMAAEGESTAAFRTILASGASSFVPPNNKGFETDDFLYTRDAIGLMKAIGLIGGTGVTIKYPGRDVVLAAAGAVASQVVQKVPNNAGSTRAFTDFLSFGSERT